MKPDREYFYELVNNIPEEKLSELRKTLLILAMPEAELTEEEAEAIRVGEEQFEKGEFTAYTSFDDMERDLLNG